MKVNVLEKNITDLWEGGVSPNSQFFKREVKKLVDYVRVECKKIKIDDLKLYLVDNNGLSKEEAKILTLLSINNFCLFFTKKQMSKRLCSSSWTCTARLSIMEANNIIKTHEYGRTRLMYLHPKLVIKWKSQRK